MTCPYMEAANGEVVCRASMWGSNLNREAKFRPILIEEIFKCSQFYERCPDYKRANGREPESNTTTEIME